jgi:hypothetical protein
MPHDVLEDARVGSDSRHRIGGRSARRLELGLADAKREHRVAQP